MKSIIRISKKIHIKFQISLLLLIILILGISTLITISAVLSISRNVSRDNANQLFSEAGQSIKLKLDNQFGEALKLAVLMRTLPEFSTEPEYSGIAHPGLPFITEALSSNSNLYSIYTGFGNGDFLQLIRTSGNSDIIDTHEAPDASAYILRSINDSGGERTQTWSFFSENLDILGSRSEASPEYDPSLRPWFKAAAAEPGKAVMTEPYIFNSLKQPGLTAAAALNGSGAAGIDITLENLGDFINNLDISPGAGILLLDEEMEILAANPVMKSWLSGEEDLMLKPVDDIEGIKKQYLLPGTEDGTYRKELSRLRRKNLLWSTIWQVPGRQQFALIITAPMSDFLKHQEIIQRRIILISTLILAAVFPAVILISIYFSRFLEHLADDAGRIQHFIFNGEIAEHSPIIEFEELAEAFRVMKKAIAAKTEALNSALGKLERIIEFGIAMSVEKDPDRLTEMILEGAKELSHADGGSVYLKGERDELDFRIVLNDSLGFIQGGTSGNPVSLPPVPLREENGEPNYHNVVSCAFHRRETIVIDDAYEDPVFDFSGTRKFDQLNNYRSTSFLTVPLKLHGGDIIGALQLINCREKKGGEVIPFSHDIIGFIEALSGLAAAILYNRILLDSQDKLFESLIHLTASAIDTKSPYTGGHCERVPVLAGMLADEAEKSTEGSLRAFRFDTPIDRKAFQLGAWLHDAGKMTTPEFIVDKAVKLETINNRIHEIRTRFEVLLRDAHIEARDAMLNGEPAEKALEQLKKAEEVLHEEFEFIASCNTGEALIDDQALSRIDEISSRSWQGHFDHTAGLSKEELGKTEVPFQKGETVTEKLLADKAVHIIEDKLKTGRKYREHGFRLPEHEHLYNRGEIHNLKIAKGTLSEEERFKINEHIMQTIIMLEQLPFPAGMTRITEYVGTHHETLTGTGYPRGLKAGELSIPSRIMAIADIFEALTASDRPYKNAKSLSEAIDILYRNVINGEIDGELFKLFLTSGIYLKYAERFLPPGQIDRVDRDKYLELLEENK